MSNQQAFSRSEQWLALRLGMFIPLVELLLRCTSFRRSRGLLEHWANALPCPRDPITDSEQAQVLARVVAHANRRYSIYPADCLTLALVLQHLLQRCGATAELCLGVRKITGQLQAHAWVEYAGIALNEPADIRNIYCILQADHAIQSEGKMESHDGVESLLR